MRTLAPRVEHLDSGTFRIESLLMPREIKLNGGEITLLKSIGLGGTQVYGKLLLERIDDMVPAEFLETLDDLLSVGYVLSSKVNVRKIEDVERAFFRVNPAYSRDLKDAINPGKKREREQRGRRDRRI
ncbi:MAG: hypothetical protein M3Z22_01240 [Verrucomicrobiota bacterium]|nr:hypothetical protein [Verrucomicrobiota bacterium]